ncbi:MAG: hypothetical protein WAV18_09405, partial [Roseiarcus sp.]
RAVVGCRGNEILFAFRAISRVCKEENFPPSERRFGVHSGRREKLKNRDEIRRRVKSATVWGGRIDFKNLCHDSICCFLGSLFATL